MAARKKEPIAKAVTDKPERFRMSEMGNLGLNIFNGVSSNELKRELNFPNSVNTFRKCRITNNQRRSYTFEKYHFQGYVEVQSSENATEEERIKRNL